MKKIVCAIATATVALLCGNVQAQLATAVMPVSALVLSSCVVAATPLLFGNYNGTSATDTTGSATVTLICAGTTTATIELDNGTNHNGTTRRMAPLLGTDRLSYGLFKPLTAEAGAGCGALTVPFGTGVGASMPVIGLTITAQIFNVCGNIPTGQSAALGAYTDVVNVNVTF